MDIPICTVNRVSDFIWDIFYESFGDADFATETTKDVIDDVCDELGEELRFKINYGKVRRLLVENIKFRLESAKTVLEDH